MMVVGVIFVVVPVLMTSCVVPSVGAVKGRDDAAAQNDGSKK